jgi:hypothetical protein
VSAGDRQTPRGEAGAEEDTPGVFGSTCGTGYTKARYPEGLEAWKGACGGAAVKMNEKKAFDACRRGNCLELPNAFSSPVGTRGGVLSSPRLRCITSFAPLLLGFSGVYIYFPANVFSGQAGGRGKG